jgi:Family of unknown function (DUF6098)
MRTITDLDELVELLEKEPDDLYVRWSKGPRVDLAREGSRDDLTDLRLPGLSANPLAVESWWGERPLSLWVARRLYDYSHLREQRGRGVRAWVLTGKVVGNGPDNEPLLEACEPVAWIDDAVLEKAREMVESQASEDWGPLDRRH